MILVSACLLGTHCRYDGGDNRIEAWVKALEGRGIVPVCPEQLGGLTTPRPPAEIVSEAPFKVLTQDGREVTEAFLRGAEETLALARLLKVKAAVLKERSPSCGVHTVYDGSFGRIRIPGSGTTARLLVNAGIPVYSEEELDRFMEEQGDAS